ncbi:8404_t:CDS:2 [Ambispora gerdemannii]|uniref:8404_t:CDS:1 n=1 Tax=Ambispora gerdemannii TaxID=144530 RepID=A0A9N8ZAB2_9GLOM|nr:8404_t:CDS:2 [Ambispora gerdemannii]
MKKEDTPNIAKLRSYLNLKARISVSDDRVFNGTFVCIDKYKNIILANTEEFRGVEKRYVGLVMVPGKHLIKAEIENLEVPKKNISEADNVTTFASVM